MFKLTFASFQFAFTFSCCEIVRVFFFKIYIKKQPPWISLYRETKVNLCCYQCMLQQHGSLSFFAQWNCCHAAEWRRMSTNSKLLPLVSLIHKARVGLFSWRKLFSRVISRHFQYTRTSSIHQVSGRRSSHCTSTEYELNTKWRLKKLQLPPLNF